MNLNEHPTGSVRAFQENPQSEAGSRAVEAQVVNPIQWGGLEIPGQQPGTDGGSNQNVGWRGIQLPVLQAKEVGLEVGFRDFGGCQVPAEDAPQDKARHSSQEDPPGLMSERTVHGSGQNWK